MTSAEFSDWQAYYCLEPFGPMGDDIRSASLSNVVATSGLVRNDGKPFKPRDFATTDWGDEPVSDDDLFEQFERAFGPLIEDGEG